MGGRGADRGRPHAGLPADGLKPPAGIFHPELAHFRKSVERFSD